MFIKPLWLVLNVQTRYKGCGCSLTGARRCLIRFVRISHADAVLSCQDIAVNTGTLKICSKYALNFVSVFQNPEFWKKLKDLVPKGAYLLVCDKYEHKATKQFAYGFFGSTPNTCCWFTCTFRWLYSRHVSLRCKIFEWICSTIDAVYELCTFKCEYFVHFKI